MLAANQPLPFGEIERGYNLIMKMNYKIKLKEKIGYGLGDAASSMFWKLFSMYLLFFYTDVFGIPAAAAGTMFLLTRIWDAANDPIMGVISDRTKSRWGKFRPYLLWLAIPFGIIGVLLFTTPDLGTTGKIVYAYVTYTVMMMIYTGVNVPYAALMGVMTPDSKQRTTLSTFRMVFAFGGSILVLASFQPLFDTFGSTTINKYTKSEDVISIHDTINTENTWIYTNTVSTSDMEITDSLLVLKLKVKTNSEEALQIGLLSGSNENSKFIKVTTDENAYGLKRDGAWSTIKFKLKDLYSNQTIPADVNKLQVAIETSKINDFEIKDIELNLVDYKSGTQKAVMIIAIVAIVFLLLTFSWTKERVKPIHEERTPVKNDFKDLLKNGPWFILLGAGVSALIFNSIRDGAAIYYFRYFIQNEDAVDLNLFGLSLPIALSTIFLVIGQAANIVGVIIAKPVSDKIGKRHTFLSAMFLAAFFSLIFYFFDRSSIIMIFVFQFIISVCAGSIFPLLWSMYADIADYSEWKTGRRATGLIFSSSSMSQKFGWTLGGAVTGWLLALYGFKADIVQAEETQNALRLMLSVFPAIGAALSVFFVYIYKLSDSYMAQINADLNEKRKS